MRLIDLDSLTPGEMDELAWLLRREAAWARRTLSEDRAWAAWASAPLTPGWALSCLSDVGRVRIATRILITLDHWRADQIRDAMLAVALHVCPERGIAELAVAAGIEDAEAILGVRRDDVLDARPVGSECA